MEGTRIIYRVLTAPLGYRSYGIFNPDRWNRRYREWCTKCGKPIRGTRIVPERYRFDGGQCADFYAGIGPILISKSATEQLLAEFAEVQAEDVELFGTRFDCEPVFKFSPISNFANYHPKSSISIVQSCNLCGSVSMNIELPGKQRTFPDERGELNFDITVDRSKNGIMLYEHEVGSLRVFSFAYAYLLCTEAFKAFALNCGWSNISFYEAGSLVAGDGF